MASELIQWGNVTVALSALLVLPAIPLSRLLSHQRNWPNVLLGAIILCFSSQSILGMAWSRIVGLHPSWEIFVYCLIWGSLFFFSAYAWISHPRSVTESLEVSSHIYLICILSAAFVIRSIHPLQTLALGQADAYAHLDFLRNIIEQGRLHVPAYPPGYHWLLALPVIVFRIDPYDVARFGGAFFGTALVLAIYVFIDRMVNRRAAIFASFCAGCFPGMKLLMKTGVGSFANQLGIFFIPCLIAHYVLLVNKETHRGDFIFFLVALLGLAASVPMMLIHILIIIGIERVIALIEARRDLQSWFHQSIWIGCLCLAAVLTVFFQVSQAGSGQRKRATNAFVEHSPTVHITTEKIEHAIEKLIVKPFSHQKRVLKSILKHHYVRLMIDFFTVKRIGFQNALMDSIAISLLTIFIFSIVYGLRHDHKSLLVIGIWGSLTSLQAGTGFLQFSAYQREGWSLLIATSIIVGVLCDLVFGRICSLRSVRYLVGFIMIGLAAWSFRHPPEHPPVTGNGSESDIVRVVRAIGSGRDGLAVKCRRKKTPACRIADFIDPELPLVIVTRHLTGWGGHGELVPNVLPLNSSVESVSVNRKKGVKAFHATQQYLVLIDTKPPGVKRAYAEAYHMVSPKMVEALVRGQKMLYQINTKIREYVSSLDRNQWQVVEMHLSDNLDGIVVQPIAH